MSFKSIHTGIALKTGICLVVACGMMFLLSSSSTKSPSGDGSRNLAVSRASNEAQKISLEVEKASRVAKAIASTLTVIKPTNGRSRSTLASIMKQALGDNNNLAAAHSYWESKVLEAPSGNNAGKPGEPVDLGWHRSEKGEMVQNQPANGTPEWYGKVKADKKPLLWGPSPSNGKGLFISSIAPIVVDGNFEGVIVTEMSLESLQVMADAAGAFEIPAQLAVVNGAGNIAAFTSHPEMAGKPFGNAIPGISREAILNGPADAQLTDGALNVVFPFKPANADKSWAVCMSLPAGAPAAGASGMTGKMVATAAGLMVLALAALWVVAGAIARPIRKAVRYAELASKGQIKAALTFRGADEVNRLCGAVNAFIDSGVGDSWRGGIATGPVQNLAHLLEVAARPAETIVSTETEEIPVAENSSSFQHVIDEISRIVSLAQEVAECVSATAASSQGRNEDLVSEIEEKTAALSGKSEAFERMSGLIKEMSENAVLSSTVAEKTVRASQEGAQAIEKSLRTLGRMSKRSMIASDRLQKLREASVEISDAVQDLASASKRISYLSLNTAIQAAEAGTTGHRFTVLAEEIERMARTSAEHTRLISNLISGIQAGTEEAISAMEDNCKDVTDSTQVAERVVQILDELQTVTNELSELSVSISKAAGQQSENSQAVSETVSELLSLGDKTTEQIRISTASVMELGAKAAELRETVSSISIPKSV